MTDPTRRTEDDLRAAFTLAAQDAPSTQDVLARLAASERLPLDTARPGRGRSWWPIAAVAAVVLAIAVPVGFAVSTGGNSSRSSSASVTGGAADVAKAPAATSAGSAAASGSAVGGPLLGPGPSDPVESSPTSGPLCQLTDVVLTFTWTSTGSGLKGTLTAHNVGGTACGLAVKPVIYPLGSNRVRLGVPNVVTAEGYAGPTDVLPNANASSTITWNSWCGSPADAGVQVDWGVGPVTVTAQGPTTPSCVGGKSGTITSTFFGPLS